MSFRDFEEKRLGELIVEDGDPLTDPVIAMLKATPAVINLSVGELPAAVDAAETALLTIAERIGIFQRAGEVVKLVRLPKPRERGGLRRPTGIVILEPLDPVALTEVFERIALFQRFKKTDKNKDAEEDEKTVEGKKKKPQPYRVDCPPRLAKTYLARTGQWQLRALSGVVAAPVLRDDGTMLARPGYDEETGLFFASRDKWRPISEQPSLEDAQDALKALLAPFEEFPFISNASKSVHAAAILTGIQRRMLGACPLIGYSAPTQRYGKSLLAEADAIIATGKPAAATGVSPQREEIRKAITSALREGHAVINLDNVDGVLESPDLARAITQEEYGDRLLGENKMLHLPTNVLWTATGNNLTVKGDLTSRTLMCRIDAGVENPEERAFKIQDLKAHVSENRAKLVAAALTILRAYHVARAAPSADRDENLKRADKLKPWGGFDDWSTNIRKPLVWAGMDDPCKTREDVAAEDPELETAAALLKALSEMYKNKDFSIHEVISVANERVPGLNGKPGTGFVYPNLHAAVSAIALRKGTLSNYHLGIWAREFRDRFVDGKRIQKIKRERWVVNALPKAPAEEMEDPPF